MALPFGLKAGMTAVTKVTSEDGTEAEYSARCLPHSIIYRLNGKPVKTDNVPEVVKEQLVGTMLVGSGAGIQAGVEEPELPAEVQHEIDSVEEEPTPPSLNVTDEVSTIDEEALRVADEIIAKQTQSQVTMATTPASPNPFYGQSELEKGNSIEDNLGFSDVEAPKIDYEELLQEAEARSVDNVNLKELIDVLYRRFRIYTPWVNQPPERTDISPTTGVVMNAFTFGQAVQGFKAAQRTGASWNPAVIRSNINSARSAVGVDNITPRTPEETAQRVTGETYGQEVDMPNLHGEPEIRVNRAFESPHQSAVNHSRGRESDGLDEDEIYADAPINAGNNAPEIIRPFYPNKKTQAKIDKLNNDSQAAVPNVSFNDLV